MHERRKKPKSSSHSELDTYLTTVFEFGDDADFQILKWWKRHKPTFSTLTIVAKQLLAVPALTVAVDQIFRQHFGQKKIKKLSNHWKLKFVLMIRKEPTCEVKKNFYIYRLLTNGLMMVQQWQLPTLMKIIG